MHSFNNKNSAFSLIELMVTIGIIAILTAIATPVYVSYTIKSKVASALSILDGLKTQSSDYYTANGSFPTTLAAVNATSYNDSATISGTSVSTTTCPTITGVTVVGCVQATFGNSTSNLAQIQGNVLSFVAVDGGTVIQWICKSGNNIGNTISNDYLPKSCQ